MFMRRLLLVLLLVGAGHARAQELPRLNIDPAQSSVSGLSSGAFMAGQFHIAFSGTIQGAGIVAGGPYHCAQGQLATALNRCMDTFLGPPDLAALLAEARTRANAGRIDPLSNLVDDKVYVFAGTADQTVDPVVGAAAAEFYRRADVPAAAVSFVGNVPAGHGFITEDGPVACGATQPPYVNDCDIDQVRDILQHIHGPLNPPATSTNEPTPFSQAAFLPNPTDRGMAATGYVYVPRNCREGAACRVHIAFHGCRQSVDRVGDAFIEATGYNRWAETNNLVILYPQASDSPGNPNGCWDWWGYTGAQYDTKAGVQLAAVHTMLATLAGETPPPGEYCERYQGSNLQHLMAGRGRLCGFFLVCAVGSGDLLGPTFAASTVYEHPQGHFTTVACLR